MHARVVVCSCISRDLACYRVDQTSATQVEVEGDVEGDVVRQTRRDETRQNTCRRRRHDESGGQQQTDRKEVHGEAHGDVRPTPPPPDVGAEGFLSIFRVTRQYFGCRDRCAVDRANPGRVQGEAAARSWSRVAVPKVSRLSLGQLVAGRLHAMTRCSPGRSRDHVL